MKKIVCLIVLAGLLVVNNSCQKDEFRDEFNSNLKSVELKEKELIEEAQNWVENNPDKNQFTLLESADKLKWNKAIINDLDTMLVIEVPVMLKSQHKVHVIGNDKLNIEHRLLIFKEKDSIYSLMEYFISEKELEYLQDTEKIKYSKKEDDFEGTIVLVDNCNEVVSTEVISKKVKSGEIPLKSASGYCVYLSWFYEDGSVVNIQLLYCVLPAEDSSSTGGGGGSSSSYSDTDTDTEASENCDCKICTTCWGCKIEPILNNETNPDIPEGDALEDNYDCPACSCPAPAELFFQEIEKISLESPTLLQDISCLLRDLNFSGGNMLITNTFEGAGDNFLIGYNIAQKFFDYLGSEVEIVVIYDAESEAVRMGTHVDTHLGEVNRYEIFVKGEVDPSGTLPNLIKIKFKPEDIGLFESVWNHIKGETNLWNCN